MRDGRVELRRTGLSGVGDEGAATLDAEVAGFDVTLTERLRAAEARQWEKPCG